MDFLDPRKRRKHRLYLMVGYGLVAVLIALGTIILVYAASGYGIDTKTGEVIQNGLLFVDSKPGGAEIYLNGKDKQATTSSRLVLEVGSYDMTLKKDGYYDWQRTIALNSQTVTRFVYPFLFPTNPVSTPVKSYTATPPLVTQTPDRRYLLVQVSSTSTAVNFEQYDLSDLKKPPVILALPANLLSAGGKSRISAVEWAGDNRHLLLKHTFSGGSEYIMFDRLKPANSINLNQALNIKPAQVSLRDKKAGQVYVLQADSLRIANIANSSLSQPLLADVLAYKTSGPDLVTYVTGSGQPRGQVAVRVWDGRKSYNLQQLAAGRHYLIDFAHYSGDWYYVAGSDASKQINLYKNPLDQLRQTGISQASALLDIGNAGADHMSFSDNARFIEVDRGQKFAVYDLEAGELYRYTLKQPLTGTLRWMDGNHLMGGSGKQVLAMDFDAANLHLLAPSAVVAGGYFSPDYNQLITFVPVAKSKNVVLTDVDMRAGKDLPQ